MHRAKLGTPARLLIIFNKYYHWEQKSGSCHLKADQSLY